MSHSLGERDIYQLIARFANSFDLKAWSDLEACLSESIYTDYSELRGTPPETMRRDQFVELRRQALQDLQTHHLAGNVEIEQDGEQGSVRVSMVIFRKSSGGEMLNTHCLYVLGIRKEGGYWRIASIVQKVFWSDGNFAIHRGISKDLLTSPKS